MTDWVKHTALECATKVATSKYEKGHILVEDVTKYAIEVAKEFENYLRESPISTTK